MEGLYILIGLVLGGSVGFFWGRRKYAELDKVNAVLEANIAKDRAHFEEKLRSSREELEALQSRFSKEFENLANRIFSSNAERMTRQNEQQLSLLLSPLKERLTEFSKNVDEKYGNEAKERYSLQREVKQLVELNQRLSQDATNLTLALKGDSKVQGDWGEFKLSQILERAGLVEGEQYTTQGRGMALKDEEGFHQKPDVIVHLPDQKHVIIDSKVSLKAFYEHVSAEDEGSREMALSQHVQSVQKHIAELSEKHYQRLKGLNCPDFVFMFVPSEPGLTAALKKSPELYQKAWDRKIVIVSPTTLFAVLQTISTLWQIERQNKNAQIIAEEGGKLYDKFVGFVEDLKRLGKYLSDTQVVYGQAMGKLSEGKGNLLSRAEKMRELGAKTKKRLDNVDVIEEEAAT